MVFKTATTLAHLFRDPLITLSARLLEKSVVVCFVKKAVQKHRFYTINGAIRKSCDSIKDLGIVFD